MARSERPKKKLNPIHLIVVDGETEKWYFDLYREKESVKNIKLAPDLYKKIPLRQQYEKIRANSSDYESIIWIIDLDVILKESKECKKGETKRIDELRKYMNEFKKDDKIHILVNTPCLEFWYLLHLRHTNRFYPDYDTLCKEFKNTILDDYEKTEKYYKQTPNDIYTKLEPLMNKALCNANKLGCFNIYDPEKGIAEIHKVFDIINPK